MLCDALLFDMDGVLYNSDEPIPGAAEALAFVRARKIPHLFLTNTSSRSRRALAEKLTRFGIVAEEQQILTPAVAAAQWLRDERITKVALFLQETARADFEDLDLLPPTAEFGADAVVIGDLSTAWDFAVLNRAFRLLISNPKSHLIALGGTKFWQAPTGLQLDGAPFTAAVECATGRKAQVIGKPSAAFFEAALRMLGVPAANTWMLGDDIEIDIGGAQCAGLKAALVQTGKFRAEQLEGAIRPHSILTSIAELPKNLLMP